MKKKIFHFLAFLLALNLMSCNLTKKKKIFFYYNYIGADAFFYSRFLGINESINRRLFVEFHAKYSFEVLKKHSEIIKSNDSKVIIECNEFENDKGVLSAINYAVQSNSEILIITTEKIVEENKLSDIHYSVVDIKKKCIVYDCSSFYRVRMEMKEDEIALVRIVDELKGIIEKID